MMVRPSKLLQHYVVVKTNEKHYFSAEENAKFIVVDTDLLPENVLHSSQIVFSISSPLLAFLEMEFLPFYLQKHKLAFLVH